MFRSLAALLFFVSIPLSSFAATPSALTLCAKGSKISAKQKCSKSEHVVTLGEASFATASACKLREDYFSGIGSVVGTVGCEAGERFVSHGGFGTKGSTYIVSVELRVSLESNEVSGVSYTFAEGKGEALEATVQVWCCT